MRTIRDLVLCVVAASVMAWAVPASASVTVSIDQEPGAILFSMPGLPDYLPGYPAPVHTDLTGTASFSSDEGSVLVSFFEGDIHAYSGQADLDCNESHSCTWSFTIPFFMGAGEYEARVTAVEPNHADPDQPFTATDSVVVTIL